MITLTEARKEFTVVDKHPPIKDFVELGIFCVEILVIKKKIYYVILKSSKQSHLYDYLNSKKDYKAKEKFLGLNPLIEYATISERDEEGNLLPPRYIDLKLPEKWVIKDKNNKRELEVYISSRDDENDVLLHELYTRVRKHK